MSQNTDLTPTTLNDYYHDIFVAIKDSENTANTVALMKQAIYKSLTHIKDFKRQHLPAIPMDVLKFNEDIIFNRVKRSDEAKLCEQLRSKNHGYYKELDRIRCENHSNFAYLRKLYQFFTQNNDSGSALKVNEYIREYNESINEHGKTTVRTETSYYFEGMPQRQRRD